MARWLNVKGVTYVVAGMVLCAYLDGIVLSLSACIKWLFNTSCTSSHDQMQTV